MKKITLPLTLPLVVFLALATSTFAVAQEATKATSEPHYIISPYYFISDDTYYPEHSTKYVFIDTSKLPISDPMNISITIPSTYQDLDIEFYFSSYQGQVPPNRFSFNPSSISNGLVSYLSYNENSWRNYPSKKFPNTGICSSFNQSFKFEPLQAGSQDLVFHGTNQDKEHLLAQDFDLTVKVIVD